MSRAVAKATKLEVVEQPMSEGAALMRMLENAARDPAVDIEKMERAAALVERREQRQAEAAFNTAMAAAQFEMTPVAKNARNSQTNSNYADIGALADAITPIYTKHGFGPSFGTDTSPIPGYIRIVCDLSHSAGFSRRYHIDLPLDNAGIAGEVNKTDTHAIGSTLTYGRRYIKLMMFDIATKDDKDGNKPKAAAAQVDDAPISDEQAAIIRNRITAKPDVHDINRFLNFLKVESLSDLMARDFRRAMALLEGQEKKFAEEAAE